MSQTSKLPAEARHDEGMLTLTMHDIKVKSASAADAAASHAKQGRKKGRGDAAVDSH